MSQPALHAFVPPPALLPCVIDVEASGFGRGSYPIEIGFVRPDGTSYCSLIKPQQDWTHWDGQAEHLHGITREMLDRHGRSAAEVAARLNQDLAGLEVYCDGWAHDYTWIAILFEAAGLAQRFRLRHLHELLGRAGPEHWNDACDRTRQSLNLTRHRASGDALVLQQALGLLRAAQA
jgi:DNA polymerase III epsilon subunit-like protein